MESPSKTSLMAAALSWARALVAWTRWTQSSLGAATAAELMPAGTDGSKTAIGWESGAFWANATALVNRSEARQV